MACCSCWLVVLLVLVVTGLVLPLLWGQGGHVLISSYAKRNPSLRIVGENCYTLLYCCLYFCFVLFLLLSLAYSRRCYHVVWLYFSPCCCCCCSCCCYCCWSCAVIVFFFFVVLRWLLLPYSLLVPITVYCCFALFRVVSHCFALFRVVSRCFALFRVVSRCCCCCCFVLLLFLF